LTRSDRDSTFAGIPHQRVEGGRVPDKKAKVGPLQKWRSRRQAKRERTGPSPESRHEHRNADKVLDPSAVARNADKMFPPQ
jgi:hypothetical protein